MQTLKPDLNEMLGYLDSHHVAMETFGCLVALTEDRSTIFVCPVMLDEQPERYEDDPRHLNWIEVTAPEPDFLQWVNATFGTAFRMGQFPGR